jgi:hypothetical protein
MELKIASLTTALSSGVGRLGFERMLPAVVQKQNYTQY